MKAQISILAVATFLFVGCFNTPSTEYVINDDKVSIMITSKTTEEELTDIAEEFLKKKNIEMDFEESTFSGSGKIKKLNLKVDCNDGNAGSALSSATEMRVRPVGFIRDYSAGTKIPFSIGSIYNE